MIGVFKLCCQSLVHFPTGFYKYYDFVNQALEISDSHQPACNCYLGM